MLEINNNESIRESELQSRLDTELMNYVSSMVRYIINPQNKLPPNLKENNLWFIFASNLLNLAAKPDFKTGIVKVDRDDVIESYYDLQSIMNIEYKPDNNLTYYPLYMIKTSNSSKFIHGLPYVDILEKWEKEFEQNPEKLVKYIEKQRARLHIDDDIEIVSAKVVGRSIHLRIKNELFDVTIPLWYSTKHQLFTNKNWETIELNDCYWNIFSPQWTDAINYYLTDEEIKQNIENAHNQWARYMVNFFAWRAPEYVSEENYKHYYHSEVDTDLSDEEAIRQYDWVLHHFKNNKRVIVKQVNDKDWNFLSSTQDQILPNYGTKNWTDTEKNNYNYWKNTYEKELYRLVNLWVDSFRIDLAHWFRKNNDCDLLYTLISDLVVYAELKLKKKIFFVLETYDFSNFWGTTPATFRDWNNNFSYPAVKVYHKETEEKFSDIKSFNWLDHLIQDLHWLLQDIRGIHGEMMAASTFDDFTLFDIAKNSGIDFKHILEMEMLLGKAGYNILSLDRDFLWEHWEIIPTVPGWHEEHYGTGKFITHSLSSSDEFQIHLDKNSKSIYESSDSINTLRKINDYWEISWISIDKNNKKLIFHFSNNSKRIFDFHILMNGWIPYSEIWVKDDNLLSKDTTEKLIKLEELENKWKKEMQLFMVTNKSIKKQVPNVYNHDFWQEFANYIRLEAWNDKSIEEWDTFKQEAYFMLNRENLIKNYLDYKNIDYTDLDNIELSIETTVLRKQLQKEVKRILNKSIKKYYPDLVV